MTTLDPLNPATGPTLDQAFGVARQTMESTLLSLRQLVEAGGRRAQVLTCLNDDPLIADLLPHMGIEPLLYVHMRAFDVNNTATFAKPQNLLNDEPGDGGWLKKNVPDRSASPKIVIGWEGRMIDILKAGPRDERWAAAIDAYCSVIDAIHNWCPGAQVGPYRWAEGGVNTFPEHVKDAWRAAKQITERCQFICTSNYKSRTGNDNEHHMREVEFAGLFGLPRVAMINDEYHQGSRHAPGGEEVPDAELQQLISDLIDAGAEYIGCWGDKVIPLAKSKRYYLNVLEAVSH